MYKLLLCWRYLRTRYIALACVVSVTLGVATMIVVNSVMVGFTREMQSRIHGILSDVVFESHTLEGFHDPDRHMAEIRRLAGGYIAGMTTTVAVPAMLSFQADGRWITRQVNFIGIDQKTHSQVSDFGRYLQHPANRERLSFALRDGAYDAQSRHSAKPREQMRTAGWEHRRAEAQRAGGAANAAAEAVVAESARSPFHRATSDDAAPPEISEFDSTQQQHTGIVMGIAMSSYKASNGSERFLTIPGDDVKITIPTAGTPPKAVSDNFTVVDFYESEMNEYDSNFVFVPIEKVQQMRGMIDPTTGIGNVTAIQIKLHNDADGQAVRNILRQAFPQEIYGIYTWRDKQGPLLASAQTQTSILNVLLFMIIAVAGFGILAIFSMIVVEKTRDIGILKSLGAPSHGIMGIFLAYGLLLGIVGSGAGLVIGIVFVLNINPIADALAWITGREVFDPSIYYFQQIPTAIEPMTVSWIVGGAMVIAVIASVLPACRAARLHPVEALRYE